jgi:hypothetical protein
MNPLLKIFITAILMILGLGLLLSGIMLWSIGREADQALVITFLIIGLIFGPGGLYFIIKMNRNFQEAELKQVLAQPERILLRFPKADAKGEIIIANDALFIGTAHIPFQAVYEQLENIRLDGNLMFFDTKVKAGSQVFHRTKKIVIPNNELPKAEAVLAQLKKDYHLCV